MTDSKKILQFPKPKRPTVNPEQVIDHLPGSARIIITGQVSEKNSGEFETGMTVSFDWEPGDMDGLIVEILQMQIDQIKASGTVKGGEDEK